MSNDNSSTPSFMSRIFANDSFRKGVAAAVAGAIVSVISETLWPSNDG